MTTNINATIHPFKDGAFQLELEASYMKNITMTREERQKHMQWCERCRVYSAKVKLTLRKNGVDYSNCSTCGLEHWNWRWQ